MRKFIVAFLLLLVFSSSIFSQVIIEKENRVENRNPGYCAWCCLEMLGRHHKIEALYNLLDEREKEFTWEWDARKREWIKSPYILTDYGSYKLREHRSPATHRAIANKLNSLDVKYSYQDHYNYDKSLLKEAIKNKQGCLVVVKWWKDANGNAITAMNNSSTHAIIILDYNEDGVEFLDPNHIDRTYSATHRWFNYYWTGYVLVLNGGDK